MTSGWRRAAARAGGGQAGHQLRCDYAIAALLAAGISAHHVLLQRITTLAALAREVRRTDPDVVVLWAPEPAPAVVRALARALRRAPRDVPIVVLAAATDDAADVDAAVGDELEHVCLALAAAWCSGADVATAIAAAPPPPQLDDLVSPWLTGVIAAQAAARVGIEIDRPGPSDVRLRRHPTSRIAAELRWIDARTAIGSTVVLHGALPGRAPAAATRLFETIARQPPRRIELGMTVSLDRPADRELLAAFGTAGGRRLTLTFGDDLPADAAAAQLAGWEAAAASGPLTLDVQADLPSDPDDLEALERLLARVGRAAPRLRYVWRPAASGRSPRRPPRLAVPELAGSPSFRDEVTLERTVRARMLRAHEGIYPATAGTVIDLVWNHPDPPSAHEDWLSQLLRTESLLVSTSGGECAAPAPLSDLWLLHGETPSRHRFEGGDAIDVVAYRAGRLSLPDVPVVLTFDEPDELQALLCDADEAYRSGRLPPALASELTRLQDGVLWSAPSDDPAPKLARVWIDAEGAVRPGPHARPLGAIGDPSQTLVERAAQQPAPASHATWLSAADVVALHAERPWLLAFAAAPAARRHLAEALGPRPGRAVVRVPRRMQPVISGLGCHVALDGPLCGPPRARDVLLRAGDAHLLFDPASGALRRVTAQLAAVWEALACSADAAAAAASLVDRCHVGARQAEALVAQVAARLGFTPF